MPEIKRTSSIGSESGGGKVGHLETPPKRGFFLDTSDALIYGVNLILVVILLIFAVRSTTELANRVEAQAFIASALSDLRGDLAISARPFPIQSGGNIKVAT